MSNVIDVPGEEISLFDASQGALGQIKKNMADRHAFIERVSREWFSYDPETGVVSWKKKPNRNIPIGRPAGCKWISGKNTYIRISVEGEWVFAHQVAFVLHKGRLPYGPVDHENGDGTDNRFSNLREPGHTGNLRNQRLNERNTSGVMGVDFHGASGKWRARIIVDQSERHLGTFDTRDEAIAARRQAEADHGFHPNHGRTA